MYETERKTGDRRKETGLTRRAREIKDETPPNASRERKDGLLIPTGFMGRESKQIIMRLAFINSASHQQIATRPNFAVNL